MVEKFTVAVEVNDSADVVYWIDADVPVAAAAAVAPEPRATLTIVVLASETAATMPQGLLTCLMLRMPSLSRYANGGFQICQRRSRAHLEPLSAEQDATLRRHYCQAPELTSEAFKS
jgi:hypothetical protein